MKREIKTTLALDGEKRFKEGLADASRQLRVLDSEMKANKASFAGNARSLEALTTKGKLFEKQVAQQKEIVKSLSQAVKDSSEKYGEADKRTDGYRIKLNNATAALAKMERELNQNSQAIAEFGADTERTASKIDKLKARAKEMGDSLSQMGDKLKGIGQTMSMSVTAPVVGFMALATEGTREFRGDIATLETNAKQAGESMGLLHGEMAKLAGVTGETDSNVEGLSNLLAAGFKGEQLTALVDQLAGASLKFKDTLKFEGVSDGLQETLATGAAIGPFAEVLERSGISLDTFNAGLKRSIANGTEQQYVLGVLADTGLAKVFEAYKTGNPELIRNAEATYNMNKAMGELGKTLDKILTPIKEKVTDLINKFNELSPTMKKIVLVVVGIAAAAGPLLIAFGAVVSAISALAPLFAVLGAAIGAISAPVAIAVGVVAGLIAIGVLLYKNWDTIKAKASEIWVAIKSAFSSAVNAVKSAVSGMIEAGKNLVQGIWTGITSMAGWLMNKVAYFVKNSIVGTVKRFLGIASPSKVMAEFGRYVAEGLAQGMEEKTSEVAQKAQQMAQAISGAVQEMNGKMSSALGLTNAQLDLQKELLGENTDEYKKTEIELKKLVKEKENLIAKIDILTAAYETAKEKLGENNKTTQQYADELALAQIELQKMDISIQKTNLSIDKQKKTVIDAAKAQAKEMRNLASEVETVEKKYREDLASAAKEYQEKVAEANRKLIEDEQKVTDDYRKQVADRTKSLRDFVGLFDAVSTDRISGRELLANLQGQVTAFADWQKNIGELAARGVDEGLIDELKEMGPKAGPQIAALNTLTDEQLTQYVYLWKEKNQLARAEAVNQLQEQRVEMQNKLQEIRWAAAEQLELYRQEWEKKNAEIRKNADAELLKIETRFKEIAEAGTKYGISLVENFTGGMESRFAQLRRTLERMAEMVDSYMPHSPAKVGPLSKIMEWGPALVGSLADGIDKSLPMLNRAMDNLALSSMTGVGRSIVNNTSNSSNTTVNITVQDGDDLLRTLHRLGVVL